MSYIKIQGVNKNYEKGRERTQALANIDLDIEKHKIIGVFGANGAGKSTLLKILSNRIKPSSGEITLDGVTLDDCINQNKVCMVSDQDFNFLSIKTQYILDLAKEYYPNYDIEYEKILLKRYNINPKKNYGRLSKGQKGIICSIIALSSKAEITILDETFVSVDAVTRKKIFSDILEEYAETERSFLLTTHHIDEVNHLLEEVIIMDKGKVVMRSNINELSETAISITGNYEKGKNILESYNILEINKFGGHAQFLVNDKLSEETRKQLKLEEFDISSMSLEQLSISLIKEA